MQYFYFQKIQTWVNYHWSGDLIENNLYKEVLSFKTVKQIKRAEPFIAWFHQYGIQNGEQLIVLMDHKILEYSIFVSTSVKKNTHWSDEK